MKTGIILEGGAMRGMFTCGVIDVLMENDIPFDGGIGVSAGAVFGCNYKSKQIGRPLRYNKNYCGNKEFASVYSLLTTGDLYNEHFCYTRIPFELDPWDVSTFQLNPMEFYCVSTDIVQGKPHYHKCKLGLEEDIRYMQASASMPIVSNIVEVDGLKLLDGGIADSIPLKYFESIGYDRNVVVLTQPKEYRKKKNKLMPIIRIALKKYPKAIKLMNKRHIVYNKTIDYILEKEEKGEILVIRPDEPLNIGSMEKDPKELDRVYQMGRKTMLRELDNLKNFIKKP